LLLLVTEVEMAGLVLLFPVRRNGLVGTPPPPLLLLLVVLALAPATDDDDDDDDDDDEGRVADVLSLRGESC
jgi:hypothetical protein